MKKNMKRLLIGLLLGAMLLSLMASCNKKQEEQPQETWDEAPASFLVSLHAGPPPAPSLDSLVHSLPPHWLHKSPHSPSVTAEP